MGIAVLQKKRQTDIAPNDSLAVREKQLKAEIASAAGLSEGKTDPVALLTQSYKQSFDAVGNARAAALGGNAGLNNNGYGGDNAVPEQAAGKNTRTDELSEARKKHDFPEYTHSARQFEQGDFCSKFSAVAFRGGTLAGAVLEGQAKNMFISCVARSKSMPAPESEMQRGILAGSAIEKSIGSQPAKAVFNRDIRSAVGIAVDAIHGAGRVMDIFKSLADGSEEPRDDFLELCNISTVKQLYPFLSIRGDRALIERYSRQIKLLENDGSPEARTERRSLEWALKKAQSVLNRKQSEQRNFLTQLNLIQNRAREAERLFTSEVFAEAVTEEIEAAMAAPPDDGSGRKRRSLNNAEVGNGTGANAAVTDRAAEQAPERGQGKV